MDTESGRPAEGSGGRPAAEQAGPAAGSKPRSPRKRVIAAVVILLLALGGLAEWLRARHFEQTDDAQIDGDISNVGARVGGVVKAVYVRETDLVKQGTLLLELDLSDLEVRLAQARAEVEQAEAQLAAEDPTIAIAETSGSASVASAASDVASAVANLAAARQQVSQVAAELERSRANDGQAQLDLKRSESLLRTNSISQAEYDRAKSGAAASRAGVTALEQSLAAAKDRTGEAEARVSAARTHSSEVRTNAPREVGTRRASVLARGAALSVARARLRQAELDLSYARVMAPVDGIVGKKSVAVGDHVAPGQNLVAITQTGHPWVIANFRETQLEHIRPGQPARIHVDALDIDLNGKVEAIGGATGARLSLFPPENAAGNYVKVVQRLPVRIRLDSNQPGLERLRPGMSVEPEVKIR